MMADTGLNRVNEVSAKEPALLIAYAQAMFMAMLSGGQILSGIAARSLGLPKGGPGLEFFSFPELEVSEWKQKYKAALDELPLDDETKTAIIQEKRKLFGRNNDIVAQASTEVNMVAMSLKLLKYLLLLVILLIGAIYLYRLL